MKNKTLVILAPMIPDNKVYKIRTFKEKVLFFMCLLCHVEIAWQIRKEESQR